MGSVRWIAVAVFLASPAGAALAQNRPASISPGYREPGRVIQRGNVTEIAPSGLDVAIERAYYGAVPSSPSAAEPAGAPREQGTVRFKEGEAAARERSGFVEVASPTADASVYLDGRLLGKTPLPKTSVPIGEHRLRIAKYGFKAYEAPLIVEGGKTAKVEAALTPLKPPARDPAYD